MKNMFMSFFSAVVSFCKAAEKLGTATHVAAEYLEDASIHLRDVARIERAAEIKKLQAELNDKA